MEIVKIVILGIIQGLTEFLPISSSGHLVIMQKLFNIEQNQLLISVLLHFGTLIPVLIVFWEDIKEILYFKKEKRYFIFLIIIASIPTALMGVFFEDFFEKLFSSTLSTASMLIVTGFILYLGDNLADYEKEITNFKWLNAVLVGIAQGIAIIPGISRSGSTITASLIQGLKKEEAARFSFILSIPVIGGAGLLKVGEAVNTGVTNFNMTAIILGIISSIISGYIAIRYFIYILKKQKLIYFSYYCWSIGTIILLYEGLF
ncbi:MAG TPA: undecaprenyl-diphosphate phosphatase [Halanaerobiales bacterium]|nr:undecaprenyl-diphosphate phosphatase [Halanaerobiales bacterium]